MDDPFLVDGRADVTRIMERLRERIGARREQVLAAGGLEEAVRLRLHDLADEADVDPELLARLLDPAGNWNISIDYRVETHRRGLSRRLVLLVKALARPVVRLYTDQLLFRQAQINAYLVHVCRRLLGDLVRLEASETALRDRCDRLERRLEALEGPREAAP